jgi:hypothetical protein
MNSHLPCKPSASIQFPDTKNRPQHNHSHSRNLNIRDLVVDDSDKVGRLDGAFWDQAGAVAVVEAIADRLVSATSKTTDKQRGNQTSPDHDLLDIPDARIAILAGQARRSPETEIIDAVHIDVLAARIGRSLGSAIVRPGLSVAFGFVGE